MNLSLPLLFFLGNASLAASSRTDDNNDEAYLQAEHQRISEEIEHLSRRQLWGGVERHLQECLELGLEPSFEDLLHGANAARGLGNAQAVHDRLRQAARINPTKQIIDWLWNIDRSYGQVELSTVPQRSAQLSTDNMPFAPDQRAAVEFAIQQVQQNGYFKGLLPQGTYTLLTETFTVVPGISLRLQVSSKRRQATRQSNGSEAVDIER